MTCCTGFPGGLLFESFVTIKGKRTSRRAMVALAKLCKDEGRIAPMRKSQASSVTSASGSLRCDVWAGHRGRAANRQLLFFTLLAQARGFSRTGMEFLNSLTVVLAPRTYDLELKTFFNTVIERERSVARVCHAHGPLANGV